MKLKKHDWIILYFTVSLRYAVVNTIPPQLRPPRLLDGLPLEWNRLRNLSSIPGTFPCSQEERACFEYGRLLHFDYDWNSNSIVQRCYPVGEKGPCSDQSMFHVDVAEATRHGGRLRGTCHFPCGYSFQTRLRESDGKCLWKRSLQAKLCGDFVGMPAREGQTTEPVWRWLGWNRGRWECQCTGPPCPQQPPLPPADGLCTAPDLANPITPPIIPTPITLYYYPICSVEEKRCLRRENHVVFRGGCYEARIQGPCNDGEWLVSPPWNPLEGECQIRPCPQGHLPLEGQCISEYEIDTHLCAPNMLYVDRYSGMWECRMFLKQDIRVASDSEIRCFGSDLPPLGAGIGHLGYGCARNDLGSCVLEAVSPQEYYLSRLEAED